MISAFLHKHDFLVRRLHSLSGLVPVGAYMVVHLLTNASILNGAGAFQANVLMIHNLGAILPVVEWAFIFGPLIFHAVVGVWIMKTGKGNLAKYRLPSNARYSMQRWSGVIAVVFIFLHVFHLHGWFHNEWWLKTVAEPLGMAQFRPYNAASTLASAMSALWAVFYVVGVLACAFHLANGIWTSGITWGVWLSPKAQKRASHVCTAFGIFIAVVGLSAIAGVKTLDIEKAKAIENEMVTTKIRTGEIIDDPHKRSHAEESMSTSAGLVNE